MKIPPCGRALLRALGLAAVTCLFAGAGHAQNFTGYDLIVPKGATPNEITVVDGATAVMPTGRSFVIGIEGGLRNPILFRNWTGSANYPIMIVNKHGTGRVNISDLVAGNPSANRATGIELVNCKYMKLRGDNDPLYRYGIEISRAGGRTSGAGQRGVDVTGKSSYIEISHLEIHDIAFAGIMVKQDPSDDPADYQEFNHPYLVYYDIKVHDNYIYNVGGEGMYIGYSKWAENRGGQGLEFCHNIIGLRVYNNLLEDCWWDGIQVGAATEDVAVYNNTILRSGASTSTHSGNTGKGIQIGDGSSGFWFNNIVVDSRGNGIMVTSSNDTFVYNNLVIDSGANGFFVDNRPEPVPAGQPADRQTQTGAAFYVYHNTVIGAGERAFWTRAQMTDNLFHNNLAVVAPLTEPIPDPFMFWDGGATGTDLGNVFQEDQTGLAFASANRATDLDYRILNASVAKDQGVAGLEMPDFFGVARPQGVAPDAGYAESGALSVYLRVTPPTSGNNGSIDAAAINGTAPYTYLWSDGNTTNPRTGLAPGHYSVVVTDAAGAKLRRATYLFTGATAGAPVTYTPLTQVETPTFNAPSGTYASSQNVTISSATPGATIRYTVDGTTPTTSYGTVGSTVAVTATGTVKAIAYKTGLDPSAVAVATYLIGVPPAAPQVSISDVTDRRLTVNWTLPGGANRVELKYSTTNGGPYTSLGVKTGTSFTHTGLVNGTTYYYVAQASSIIGTGPLSAQASATPFGFYATRTILSAPALIAGPTTTSGASASGVFDEPPTWDAVNLVPVGIESDTGQANVSATNCYWCIDFGTTYSSFHLTEMWTRYKANSSAPHAGFPEVWWDDDKDITNDGTSAGTMNFNTATSLPNSSSQQWYRDRDYTSAPITAQNRYLVFKIPPGSDNKPNEMAFVGWQDGTPAAPTFTQHPQSQAAAAGAHVTLSANALGSPAPTFHWRKNGVNISGATGQTFTLANIQATDAGSYTAVATNSAGATTSNAAVITVSGGTPTITILTPVGQGTAGTLACTAAGAFNEQPTWDAVAGAPTGISATPHSTTTTAYTNRYFYIDFGANYANLRITEMWTRYRPYSSGNHPGFAAMWWDDDIDTAVDNGVSAPTMNFGNGQGLPSSSAQMWVQDRNFAGTPITPQRRYLLVSTGASPSDRPNEFAFVGYTVP